MGKYLCMLQLSASEESFVEISLSPNELQVARRKMALPWSSMPIYIYGRMFLLLFIRTKDPSLWVQALSYFARRETDCRAQIMEVLSHILFMVASLGGNKALCSCLKLLCLLSHCFEP